MSTTANASHLLLELLQRQAFVVCYGIITRYARVRINIYTRSYHTYACAQAHICIGCFKNVAEYLNIRPVCRDKD